MIFLSNSSLFKKKMCEKVKKFNMYLRPARTYLIHRFPRYYDTQKIQITYDFLLKSQYYDTQKYEIKYVFKTSSGQSNTTMIPKEYRYL